MRTSRNRFAAATRAGAPALLLPFVLAACAPGPGDGGGNTGTCVTGRSEERTRYFSTQSAPGEACRKETQSRRCEGGAWTAWSGSFTELSCEERPATCDGKPDATVETRTRYRTASVPAGRTCEGEEQQRVCGSGSWSAWSGTFGFEACEVADPLDCEGTPDGESQTRTRYASETVPFGATCESETQARACRNGEWGAWSGTYVAASCSVEAPASCGTVAHGGTEERTRYQSAEVPYGGSCVAETQRRTCDNGLASEWSGSYTAESCAVAAPAPCGAEPHGAEQVRTRYAGALVNPGERCVAETQRRACSNGTWSGWSGTFAVETCRVGECAKDAGESRTRFAAATVPFGDNCRSESQTRTCVDGLWSAWSGTFGAETCSVSAPADCEGGRHGTTEQRTRYEAARVEWNKTCQAETQTRSCHDGVWSAWRGAHSPAWTEPACVVAEPLPCGASPHRTEESRTRYAQSRVLAGESCSGAGRSEDQSRICINGEWSAWTGTMTVESCSAMPEGSCGLDAPGATQSRTMFLAASVPGGENCVSEVQTRTCAGGNWTAWSGTFAQTSCTAGKTIVVTTVDDTFSGPGCSLRAAIEAANKNLAVAGCPAGAGEDLIEVPPGTYTLTLAGTLEDRNAQGDLDVTEALVISGAGKTSTVIDANRLDRVLHATAGARLALENLSIVNGLLPDAPAAAAGHAGGGVLAEGDLRLENVRVAGNTAGAGGKDYLRQVGSSKFYVATVGGHGGGVAATGPSLVVTGSTFENNLAGGSSASIAYEQFRPVGGSGGGVHATSTSVVIKDSDFRSNAAATGGIGAANSSSAGGNGGAVAHDRAGTGQLLVERVIFAANKSGDGGAAITGYSGGTGGSGGAIWASAGEVTVKASSFSLNVAGHGQPTSAPIMSGGAGGRGGALFADGANVMIENSVFDQNRTGDGGYSFQNSGTGGAGGAVCIERGNLVASDSTFSANTTGKGGGGTYPARGGNGAAVSVSRYVGASGVRSTASLARCTFSGNIGGAGGSTANGADGTLHADGTDLVLVNSTLSGNSVAGRGGAIFLSGTASIKASASTLAGNTARDGGAIATYASVPLKLRGMLVAGNVATAFPARNDCFANTAAANVDGALGGNVFGVSAGCTAGPGDVTTADAMLEELADNGGPTKTRALQAGSPAIGTGACLDADGNVVSQDQRGSARPATGCDAGAFELP